MGPPWETLLESLHPLQHVVLHLNHCRDLWELEQDSIVPQKVIPADLHLDFENLSFLLLFDYSNMSLVLFV